MIFTVLKTKRSELFKVCRSIGELCAVSALSLIMASNILRTALSRIFEREEGGSAETPELYLRLTCKCMEQVDRTATVSPGPKFNQEQCRYLVDKLKMSVRSARSYVELISTHWYSTCDPPSEDRARSLEIFKLLFVLSKEVEDFIQGCCKDAWIQSAILLANVSDRISSLSFSLEMCKIVFANRKLFGAIPSLTLTEVASVTKVEAETAKLKANLDEQRLTEDLNGLINVRQQSSSEWQLATFLLKRLESKRQHLRPSTQGSQQSSFPEILGRDMEEVGMLGKGAYGIVHKMLWMGVEVAKKTFDVSDTKAFLKEVSTLEVLRHTNIVSLLWHMSVERKCYIVMELMDEDLNTLMQKRLEKCATGATPFTISEAVHIMLQVAEGMLFLHEKKIVHRDLKSHNILVKCMKTRLGTNFLQAKVADFGLSRTKENSVTYTNQTQSQGTTRWMAPEMIKIVNIDGQEELKDEAVLKYPFKVDVYSFGMVCFEILTGDEPFLGLRLSDVKKTVLVGGRPQLPDRCPDRLKTLIEACWSSEPSKRPRFCDICAELRHLKCALFMTSAWAKAPRRFNVDEIRRMTNSFSNHRMLSWGALTMVYKGVVVDTGEVVAAKRILGSYSRCPDEFKTQMGLLSGFDHNDLVRCVGFCHGEDETILVFEYMPNDSLDKSLFDHERKISLTWPVRRNICQRVASGIHYLHSVGQSRLIHSHIRSSNILLDQNLNPKVSLQLALLVSENGSELRSPPSSASTLGYLAPDYGTLGRGREAVDVFNFGVVLLEIVSGRRIIDPKLPEEQLNLGDWARKLQSEGRSFELIDPTLKLEQFEVREAVRIIQIALLCGDTRPEMALVVAEISKLGLEHGNECSRMSRHGRQASFGASSGDFEGDLSVSIPELNNFGEPEEQVAAGTEKKKSIVAIYDGQRCKEDLEKEALNGVDCLSSASPSQVLQGFALLIKCASSRGGPLAVLNTKHVILARPASPDSPPTLAVPTAIKLAKTQDPQYIKLAMKLMVALTSDEEGEPDNDVILEVADAFDFLISLMREERLTTTRLLAAETVVNILVNKEVRKMAWIYDGIVPTLLALSNGQNVKHRKRADDVCLKGLKRLAKCEMTGDKTQMIVVVLIKLLHRGLRYQPELRSLVKDSLVALENQVLAIEHATSTNEVCTVVWKDMLELMLKEGLTRHISVPGRMAIVSIMTKLCALYTEDIKKHLFWFLLDMVEGVGFEIAKLLGASHSPAQVENVAEQLRDLKKLLASSVGLLSFCVTHGENMAQSSLFEMFVEKRETLQNLIVHGGIWGISDDSRLQIMSILDQINAHPMIFPGEIKFLVDMSKSIDEICRQHVANRLRMLVEEKKTITELNDAGGIAVLMKLLRDANRRCQRDALVALSHWAPSTAIPVDRLPFQIILDFLDEQRDAAMRMLYLMVKANAASADVFVNTKEALEATLNLLENDLDTGPVSRMSAHALLVKLAKEDLSVHSRIAEPGSRTLDILVIYVRDRVRDRAEREKLNVSLTTTLVQFCGSGEACQEAVVKAAGHVFLIASLKERKLQKEASQGLFKLLEHTGTREQVLKAGFLTTAIGSIDTSFACTDIARSLELISRTSEGLNQIYSDPHSVSALSILLVHCHDLGGMDLAALVIARLYPCLSGPEDVERQIIILKRCDFLANCLVIRPSYRPRIGKGVLEALAAIAAEEKGRQRIYESEGPGPLIGSLKYVTQQADYQGLVLKILAEMSSDRNENTVATSLVQRIRNDFVMRNIYVNLFNLFNSNDFLSRTENVKCALILIRNMSLAGSHVCEKLARKGAVARLVDVLRRQESPLSVVTELAVYALEKFLDGPKGKQVFLEVGGIQSLSAVLKLDALRGVGDAKCLSNTILNVFGATQTALANDPRTRKAACFALFECDILPTLNEIIRNGKTNKVRWQAAVLMKLLAEYGPTKHVCSAMRAKGCLDALIALRTVTYCDEVANDALKFVSEESNDCKVYIDGCLSRL